MCPERDYQNTSENIQQSAFQQFKSAYITGSRNLKRWLRTHSDLLQDLTLNDRRAAHAHGWAGGLSSQLVSLYYYVT